uniref:Major facilitator superfamily (MFS) profile domain-containing protein n=1 Tax=Lepeophtheirus salmonis TaxID=72036 RepID=A0A0K2V1N3_LEPSM
MKSHTSHTDQRGSTVLTPIANVWQNVRDTSETSNSYSKQKQIFATLFASLGCFLNGTSIGYTGVAIPSLMNGTFDVYGFPADYSQQQVSWITSLMYVGCILGGLFSRFFMDFMGRRRTLLYIVNTFYLSGHILIFFGSCAEMFYIGRILNGIALGLELCVASVYIVEISSTDMRAILGYFIQFMGTLGVLYSFTMGGLFFNWNGLTAASGVFIIPFILATYFMPESPHWLLLKGYEFQAVQSLEWLRGRDDAAVELEILKIKKYLVLKENEKLSGLGLIKESPKTLLISLTMMFFWMFSGYSLYIVYSVSIFEMVGSSIKPSSATIIVGLVLLLSCLVSVYTVSKWSRKWMMIVSMFLIFFFNLIIGFCMFLHERAKSQDYNGSIEKHLFISEEINSLNETMVREEYLNLSQSVGVSIGWIPLLCVIGIIFFGNVGQATLIWIVTSEITPPKSRNIVNSILISFAFFCGFLVTKTFVDFVEIFKESKTFWIYSGIAVFGTFFIMIFVPETKGKTNNEMRIYFGKGPKKHSIRSKHSNEIPLQEIS